MKRRILLCLFFIISLWVGASENASDSVSYKLTVRGMVYERQTLDPMIGASVQLFNMKGDIVKSAVTSDKGSYILPDIPSGAYQMKFSYVGFDSQTLTVKLPQKSGNFKASDVLLRESSQWLKEAVVTAKAAEMTVVEDTVMYHANAYTVPEGSVVEELIKKLPGVEIEDGKITVNGKEVSQILVDGKEFFGTDKEITLKNLPADIVDKIKTYEKKSDNARISGIDDGNEQTVIDLSVKEDKKKGWFGNIDGAYGTHDRYDGRINVNRFTGDRRFSLIGNANNTRGGGQRSDQSGGLNFYSNSEKLEVNGNVRLNTSQNNNSSWGSSQSFENSDAAYSNWRNNSSGNSIGSGMDVKLEWRPDTMTNVLFRSNLSQNKNRNHSNNESATFNDDPYLYSQEADPLNYLEYLKDMIGVNHNLNGSSSKGYSWNGNGSLSYNRRMAKKGRNLNIRLGGGFGDNVNESGSYSQIDYYQILAANGGDSVYHKVQFNESSNNNHRINTGISYSEPLNETTFLQFSYNFSFRYQNNDRTVCSLFDPWIAYWGVGVDNYMDWESKAEPDIDQCRYVENKYYNHDIRLQVRMNRTKYNLTAGVNIQPQKSVVEYTKGKKDYHIGRTVVNAAPTANFRYRFSRQEQFRFTYRGNTGQPGMTDLIPDTLNNANPLNIRLGNAELKPSFTHQIRADYNKFIQEHQRSYAFGGDFRTTQNAVSSRTEYNPLTGGRITKPENINGNWNASGYFNFNTAFRDDRFRINANSSVNYTNAVGFVYQYSTKETVKNRTGSLSARENVRGAFRNEWLEVAVHGSVRYNHSRSTSASASNLDTYTFNYGGSTQMDLPWDVTISTDITNNCRRGYSEASMNTDELIWNMQLSKQFLKGNAATLSFRWYDILAQRSNVRRNVSAFSRTDSSSENIYSYCMLHFIYRFNVFGGKSSRREQKDFERNRPDHKRGTPKHLRQAERG